MGKVDEYTESLFTAVDKIVEARIDSVHFDQTIQCIVVDISNAEVGEYIVSNGSAKFTAYSTDTKYKVKDNVLVTIPQGDYNEQKVIVGKYVSKNTQPYVFKNPLDYYLDITGNLVGFYSSDENSLLANCNNPEEKRSIQIAHWEKKEIPLIGFDRLAVKADFMSLLGGYDVVSGNYGLKITVKGEYTNPDTDTTNTNPGEFERNYQFNIDNMYGNPYDFDTYYNQQALFDISNFEQITAIDIFFEWFEEFFDRQGERVPYEDPTLGYFYDDNLFTKGIYVSLGYDESQFDGDKLILYTENSLNYSSTQNNSSNEKKITARWIHKDETGEILIVNDLTKAPYQNVTNLWWYQFDLSAAAADQYCGIQWKKIDNNNNIFNYTFTPSRDLQQEQIKAIIFYNDKIIRSNTITFVNEKLVPNIQNQSQIQDDFYLEATDNSSGVYNLYKQDNTISTIKKTVEIEENGEPTSKEIELNPSNEIRELAAKFQGSDLADIEYIHWKLPLRNSFLTFTDVNGSPLVYNDVNGYHLNSSNVSGFTPLVDNNYLHLYGQETTDIASIEDFVKLGEPLQSGKIFYKIASKYINSNINNTVICEILKDHIKYIASFTFTFGYNNTNGSDYTVAITFEPVENNKPVERAMLVAAGSKLKVKVNLYDANNNLLDFNNNTLFGDTTIEWSWKHAVATDNYGNCYTARYEPIDNDNIIDARKNNNTINSNSFSPTYYIEDPNTAGNYILPQTAQGQSLPYNKDTQYYIKVLNEKLTPHILLYEGIDDAIGSESISGHKSEIYLSATSNLTINELYILQVTISGFLPYNLVAYQPIPLYQTYTENNSENKLKPIYNGPDFVYYDTTGNYTEVIYNKSPCTIEWRYNTDNILWVNNQSEVFEICSPALTADANSFEKHYIGRIDRNVLYPTTIYFEDAPVYGIQAKVGGNVYYTQPICCYQNKWPNTTVNQWDGVGLNINEEDGTILGHAFIAGHKERNNTYTGVMFGDLSSLGTNQEALKQTGVYGFHHGSVSYAFKEDGTAFIGKSGHGRLMFDGNSGQIQSASWEEGLNSHGMKLDLDDGYIQMIKPQEYTILNINDQTELNNTLNNNNSNIHFYKKVVYSISNSNSRDVSLAYYLPEKFISVAINQNDYNSHIYYTLNTTSIVNNLENTASSYGVPYIINNAVVADDNLLNNGIIEEMRVYNRTYPNIQILTLRYQYNQSEYTKTLVEIILNSYSVATGEFDSQNSYWTPDQTSFSYATSGELSSWHSNWFYILSNTEYIEISYRETYIPGVSYYYTQNNDQRSKYIDLGVNQSTYPLSIGSQAAVAARPFRINWDGEAFISNGHFTGSIDAKEGTLRDLEIKGKLYTSNYKNYINSNSRPGIYGAYIEGSTIKGTSIEGAHINATYINTAYLEADTSGSLAGWNFDNTGLFNGNSSSSSAVSLLSTPRTVANSLGQSASIILRGCSIAVEGLANRGYGLIGSVANQHPETQGTDGIGIGYYSDTVYNYFTADNAHIGINGGIGNFYMDNTAVYLSGSNIVIRKATSGNNLTYITFFESAGERHLRCEVPPQNQEGIYARFA